MSSAAPRAAAGHLTSQPEPADPETQGNGQAADSHGNGRGPGPAETLTREQFARQIRDRPPGQRSTDAQARTAPDAPAGTRQHEDRQLAEPRRRAEVASEARAYAGNADRPTVTVTHFTASSKPSGWIFIPTEIAGQPPIPRATSKPSARRARYPSGSDGPACWCGSGRVRVIRVRLRDTRSRFPGTLRRLEGRSGSGAGSSRRT